MSGREGGGRVTVGRLTGMLTRALMLQSACWKKSGQDLLPTFNTKTEKTACEPADAWQQTSMSQRGQIQIRWQITGTTGKRLPPRERLGAVAQQAKAGSMTGVGASRVG